MKTLEKEEEEINAANNEYATSIKNLTQGYDGDDDRLSTFN